MGRYIYQQPRIWLLVLLVSMPTSQAGVIAIIIDDIGYSYQSGLKSAAVHPNITLSILPDAPFSKQLAVELSSGGHELMLHLPMQTKLNKASANEPVFLTEDMQEAEYKITVLNYLKEFPEVHGANNHMGSLLTQKPKQMKWLMEALLSRQSMYFVDSRTHKDTVAQRVASKFTVKNARRDVFLDHGKSGKTREGIWKQIRKLQHQANRTGFALAIGHPRSKTLAILQKALPWLESLGHTIVPISRYIQLRGSSQCPGCLSPLLKVVKNSKP
jgi:polysaccharide deacetylase 2 family uncharacterized protein YibQ